MPNRAGLSRTGEGFVALGVTFLAYGLTELAHGYGFLAVFVAALAVRSAERQHEYHERLHDFADQTERLMMMVVLVLFGGALAGGLLDALTWAGVAAGLVLRGPASGGNGLSGLLLAAVGRACGRRLFRYPWARQLLLTGLRAKRGTLRAVR